MHALAANGDAAAALQHARIYEVLVAQELELPADGTVLDLARRIRAGEIAARPRAVAAAAPPAAVTATSTPGPAGALAAEVVAATASPGPTEAPAPAPATPAPTGPLHGIAVLPFVDLAGDAAGAALAAGAAEEVIHQLTFHPALGVVARSASAAFPGPAVDLTAVAARLGVAAVLEGSVRHDGRQSRVTVRLVDVTTRLPRWSARVDGELDDLFELQDAVAACVVARLTGTDAPARTPAPRPESARLAPRAPAARAAAAGSATWDASVWDGSAPAHGGLVISK